MRWKRALSLFTLGFIFSLPSYSFGELEGLVGKAKQEGILVWYATTSNPDNQAIIKGFNRKYPFLKVKVLRTTGEKLRTRILTEAAAGKSFFDTVVVSVLELGLLRSRKILLAYRPPEAQSYPAGAKDRCLSLSCNP